MRVYVAGPLYSSGHWAQNIQNAVLCAATLMKHGHAPYVPHLSHFANDMVSFPEARWLELDKEWLLQCQAMIRLPGSSKGADLEHNWAEEAKIPVFKSVEDFLAWADIQQRPNIGGEQW